MVTSQNIVPYKESITRTAISNWLSEEGTPLCSVEVDFGSLGGHKQQCWGADSSIDSTFLTSNFYAECSKVHGGQYRKSI